MEHKMSTSGCRVLFCHVGFLSIATTSRMLHTTTTTTSTHNSRILRQHSLPASTFENSRSDCIPLAAYEYLPAHYLHWPTSFVLLKQPFGVSR